MPPVRSKTGKSRDPENEIKLFASSKRSSEVKIKPKARARAEDGSPSRAGASLSQTPMKGTLEEAMELSDSEAEAPQVLLRLSSKSQEVADAGSSASSDAPFQQGHQEPTGDFVDFQGEVDADADQTAMPPSTSSTKSTPKRKNTAKCSRGKKKAKLRPSVTHEDFAIRKVSAFKPMESNGKSSDSSTTKIDKNAGKGNANAGEESTDEDFEPDTTGDTDMTYDTMLSDKLEISKKSPLKKGKTKALVTDESDVEEFHELSDFRRSVSAQLEASPTIVAAAKPKILEKERTPVSEEPSLSSSGEGPNSASTNVEEPLRSHVESSSKETTPRIKAALATTMAYISREEHESTIKRLREEWKEEMSKMQTAMRIETKRLIRSEVRDEILLSQPS